jgi:hypothetical protein
MSVLRNCRVDDEVQGWLRICHTAGGAGIAKVVFPDSSYWRRYSLPVIAPNT